ncbi:MAG: HTH domain-containing protein, partial [Alistipes sp.]|nr:HTH domain-containing protein [Alistipes sp.]
AYNLTILKVAFEELKQYINRKVSEKNLAAAFYQKLGHLNERQAAVIRIIAKNPQQMFTAKELQIRFGITHATAKSDLNDLIAKGLMEEIQLNKVKRGYIRSENFDEIIQSVQP